MSNKIKGTVLVSGQIAPSDERDLYPTHEDIFGKGGYMTCGTIAERDAIPDERRKEGMAVYVTSVPDGEGTVAKLYVLEGGTENNDWTEWPFGSEGGDIEVKNEDNSLTTKVKEFKFTGAGVTASVGQDDDVTVTIPGAGAGNILIKEVTITPDDFLKLATGEKAAIEILDSPSNVGYPKGSAWMLLNIYYQFLATSSGTPYTLKGGDGPMGVHYNGVAVGYGSIVPRNVITSSFTTYFADQSPMIKPEDMNLDSTFAGNYAWITDTGIVFSQDGVIVANADDANATNRLKIILAYTAI